MMDVEIKCSSLDVKQLKTSVAAAKRMMEQIGRIDFVGVKMGYDESGVVPVLTDTYLDVVAPFSFSPNVGVSPLKSWHGHVRMLEGKPCIVIPVMDEHA